MDIKDMHYDFKKKLNKVDSNQYRNLLIPEIDWVLNEAQSIFIDLIAAPRAPIIHGFERNQKNIDDIYPLVVDEEEINLSMSLGQETVIAPIPERYLYYVKSFALISNEECKNEKTRNIKIERHGDEFLTEFYKPSFTWRHVNGLFVKDGIKLYTDKTFKIDKLYLSYIKKPAYIHNAEDFRNGSYKLPSGETLTGSVSSDLPSQTLREIVDIAVMITSGELQIPDYQIKNEKIGLNFLNYR